MIKLSNGNKKIGNDTLIINFNSATDCPSRNLGLCNIDEGKCYALKAERIWPQVLPYRRMQALYWNSTSSDRIAADLLSAISRKKNPIKYIRFSESGDFDNQLDVDKLKDVALRLSEVTIYGYTARRDLRYNNLPDNLIINGSGFMVSNMFTATREIRSGQIQCPGNCRNCNLCKQDRKLDIKVLYH
jgi:hypothetical protein